MTGTPLRLGVLGCADIALRRILPAAAAAPGIEVTAIASRDAAKAGQAAARFGGSPVTGYATLLDRDDVDAVYVPLPVALHADWVEAALSAGKHVLAEKPLTTDPGRTAALVGKAVGAGLVLRENIMFVHHRQHAIVAGWVADGVIGRLRSLTAAFGIPARPDGDIRYRADLAGGARFDVGTYPVRAAAYFLGPDLTVLGATEFREPGREVDTAGAALLTRADGVTAHLTYGLDHAYRSEYELWGSDGRITVTRAFTPPADHRPVVRLERGGSVENHELPADDQVTNTLTTFAADVREGRLDDPSIVRQAELLAAVARST